MSDKLGIDLKDLIKLVSKIKKQKKDKKKKNKKSKKKMYAHNPIQNNKPNFGHQNQIGGGGGIGGTSFNPLAQQRSAPVVTTVVNTPPTGGQIGGQNGGQTEHYNKLYESTKKGYELLHNGIISSVNYLGDKIDEINKSDKKMIKYKKEYRVDDDTVDEDDNIGFPTSSYHNPLSHPTLLNKLKENTKKIQSLSDQKGGSFRNSPQSNTLGRFGVSPINGNGTQNIYQNESESSYHSSDNNFESNAPPSYHSNAPPSYHSSDNHFESDAPINREFEDQESEPLNDVDVTQTERDNFGYVEDYPSIQKNYDVNDDVANDAVNVPLSNSQIEYVESPDLYNYNEVLKSYNKYFKDDAVNVPLSNSNIEDDKLPDLGNYSDIEKAYTLLNNKYNDFDNEVESIKKKYYNDDTEDEKSEKKKTVKINSNNSSDPDERLNIQLQKEKEEAEAYRLQQAQEVENKAREKAELWFNSGRRPRGGISKRTHEIYNELQTNAEKNPLISSSLQSLNKPTNNNSKLVYEDEEEKPITRKLPKLDQLMKNKPVSSNTRSKISTEEIKEIKDDKPKKMTNKEALAKAREAKANKKKKFTIEGENPFGK